MSGGPDRAGGGAAAPVAGVGTLVPLRLVAIPLVAGLFAELAGWLVIAGAAPLHAGWYGWKSLLLGVHLVVIGGLLWPVVGAGWQLAPVVLAAPLPPRVAWLAGRAGPGAVVGALLLWIGLGGARWIGALGASLVISALLARSAGLVPLLLGGLWGGRRGPGDGLGGPEATRGGLGGPEGTRGGLAGPEATRAAAARPAPSRIAIRLWLLAAEACLWGGLGYAALLYAGKLGHPVLADPIAGVGTHFSLLAVGWVGGWEIGLGALLLPMFALGREPPPGAFVLAGVAWFGGIASGSVLLWAVGAGLAAGILLRALGGGARAAARSVAGAGAAGGAGTAGVAEVAARVGPGLTQAAMALGGLGIVAIGAAFGVLTGPALVAALVVGWLLPLQHGVALRVVPFLLWAHLLAGRPGPAPTALASARMGWAQLGATALGGALLVGGLVAQDEGVARAGAGGMALGAALHLLTVGGTAARAVRAWRAAVALPGTAAASGAAPYAAAGAGSQTFREAR